MVRRGPRQNRLAVRLLVNRGCNGALLEVGGHFRKQVRGDELDFSGKAPCPQGTAYRQAIHGVYVNPGKGRDTA